MNYEKAIANIRKELKDYLLKCNLQSLVIGISGGIDSCLCAALAYPVCDELNIPLIGRSLPTSTNAPDEIERARLTGKVFCNFFDEVNLAKYFENLSDLNTDPALSYITDLSIVIPEKDDDKSFKIRNGNIKARLRMIYLYNLASKNRGIVLSTDNYTEYLLGFWTLHGDVGDYGMIQNLWKTEVYEMSQWMVENDCKFLDEQTALQLTINAMATDGLGVSNLGDLGQIMPDWTGTSRDGYKEVDRILQLIEKLSYKNPHHELDNHPVIQRHIKSEFKRHNPTNISRNLIIKE